MQEQQFTRKLRKTSTEAEKCLWYQLRNRNFKRYKFRHQHKIGYYTVDFVCLHRRLVIKLDGGQHLEQKEYDERRTLYLRSRRFNVLRFWNKAVFENIESILEEIYRALTILPHPVPLQKIEWCSN